MRRKLKRALNVCATLALLGAILVYGGRAAEFSGPTMLPDLALLHSRSAASDLPLLVRTLAPGTPAGDVITLHQGEARALTVTVNGEERTYFIGEAWYLAVDAGEGNDVVLADASVTSGFAVIGGAGDDYVVAGAGNDFLYGGPGDDTVYALAGDDLVDAGPGADRVRLGPGADGVDGGEGPDDLRGDAGPDYLQGSGADDRLDGGSGGDVLYGLDGRDALLGGDGVDYLDGGVGADALDGQGGYDMLFGGAGPDRLDGFVGDDLVAGGPGRDRCWAGSGSPIYSEPGDLVAGGDPENTVVVDLAAARPPGAPLATSLSVADDGRGFAGRVASDLQALRSLPVGAIMLEALETSGETVVIEFSEQGNSVGFDRWPHGFLREDGSPGPGTGSCVRYNPFKTTLGDGDEPWMRRPPIVGLYHELVHALNAATGTLQVGAQGFGRVRRFQLQAIGQPSGGVRFDGDHDPATAATTGNPAPFTENGIRSLLGLPLRPGQ